MLSLPLGVRPVALRLRGGAVGSSARRLRAAAESDGPTAPSSRQRGDAALPEFRHCHWRINASRAPGAWPGPATTFLFPTDEELNEFGNGKAYPGADGENVTLEEFVMDLSTHLGLLPVTSEECITRLCYKPDDIPDKDWDPFSQHGGLWNFLKFSLPSPPLDAAARQQMRLDDDARNSARMGNWQQLLQLASIGANVSAPDINDGDATALHVAAAEGHIVIIQVLAQMRVPVDIEKSNMRTPLHQAAAAGQSRAVMKLAELGADVNATCVGDFTPMHLAAMNGQDEAVGVLLTLGSCVWARDWQFRTPLQVADYWNHTAIVHKLGKAMNLGNDPSIEVCGDWWQRHVVAYDQAHNLTYECWCSACHCPSPDGEKDLDFLRVKYGWDADRALRRRTMPPAPVAREGQLTAQRSGGNSSVAHGQVGSIAGAHSHKFTVEDDLDLFAADGLDFRHVSVLHPIYNATWNAQAKRAWLARRLDTSPDDVASAATPDRMPVKRAAAASALPVCKRHRGDGLQGDGLQGDHGAGGEAEASKIGDEGVVQTIGSVDQDERVSANDRALGTGSDNDGEIDKDGVANGNESGADDSAGEARGGVTARDGLEHRARGSRGRGRPGRRPGAAWRGQTRGRGNGWVGGGRRTDDQTSTDSSDQDDDGDSCDTWLEKQANKPAKSYGTARWRCYQNMMKAWAHYSSDDVNPLPDTTFSSSGVSTTLRPPSCALSRHVLCFPNAGNRACPRVSPDLFPPRKTSDSFFADPILQHAFGHPHQQMKYSHEQTRHLGYPYQQQPYHHLPGGQRKHASPAAILALFDDRPGRQTTQSDGGTAGGGKEPDTADATQQN